MKKLGLIVNPIAGMGGRVGLKGTDGPDTLKIALGRGAVPLSPSRAIQALETLRGLQEDMTLFTFPGQMGEAEAVAAGIKPHVLLRDVITGVPTREHTLMAARELLQKRVDLLLFGGGDGTARDVAEVVNTDILALGIPSGVKIHSSVFATSPRKAGELAKLVLSGKKTIEKYAEVMDIDEEAFRKGQVQARLYSYLKIPFHRRHVQSLKSGSPASEGNAQVEIAREVISQMEKDRLYLLGPGTTTGKLKELLRMEYSLLGIDAFNDGRSRGKDLRETDILQLFRSYPKRSILITPIGGQGFLLGRGNQQISPEVIRETGKENIIVVCTPQKLHSLKGSPFLVDTGDPLLDRELGGYVRVLTGIAERTIYPVST